MSLRNDSFIIGLQLPNSWGVKSPFRSETEESHSHVPADDFFIFSVCTGEWCLLFFATQLLSSSCQCSFLPQVNTVKMPYIIPPGPGSHTPISVEFTPTSSDCMVSTDVRFYSNASVFSIPVYCYDGSLQVSVFIHTYLCSYTQGQWVACVRTYTFLSLRNHLSYTITHNSMWS